MISNQNTIKDLTTNDMCVVYGGTKFWQRFGNVSVCATVCTGGIVEVAQKLTEAKLIVVLVPLLPTSFAACVTTCVIGEMLSLNKNEKKVENVTDSNN